MKLFSIHCPRSSSDSLGLWVWLFLTLKQMIRGIITFDCQVFSAECLPQHGQRGSRCSESVLLTMCSVNCVHAFTTCVPVMVASLQFICLCTDEPPKLDIHLLVRYQMAVLQMFCHTKCMVSICPLFDYHGLNYAVTFAHLLSQYPRMFVRVCVHARICACVSVCVMKQLTPLLHVWHINKQHCVLDSLQLTATVSCF